MANEFEDATVDRVLAAIREMGAIKVMLGMSCMMEQEVDVNEEGGVGTISPIWENDALDEPRSRCRAELCKL